MRRSGVGVRRRWWLRVMPVGVFEGLVEAFNFSAGLRVVGPGVDVVDAQFAEQDLQCGAAATAGGGGEDGAVVGQHPGRCAPLGEGGGDGVDDVGAGHDGLGEAGDAHPGVVVNDVEVYLGAVGQAQWVTSACHSLLGCSAQKRFHAERGRSCGCAVMKPRRVRMRQIVETAGTVVMAGSVARWAAMVSAPASKPCLSRVLRSCTMRSSSSIGTARGLWCGRRDRGWNAAAPSVSYRRHSCCTQVRETS